MVVPELQGRGIAAAATARSIELAKHEDKHRFLHAFPNLDNASSNAVCRKLGFELLEAVEFEFPKEHFMTCNDWRMDLHLWQVRRGTPGAGSPSDLAAPNAMASAFGSATLISMW